MGYDLSRLAQADGIDVISLTRTDLDLSDLPSIAPRIAALDFDIAVNCAAYTAVDRAEAEATAAFTINAYAAEQIAIACAIAGRPMVQLSTDYVFDGETSVPYSPDSTPGPINVYGASKLAGETLVRRAHPHGALVVRTSSVFGSGAPGHPARNFVRTILRLASERAEIDVVNDTCMAPTYSADLAAGILRLIEANSGAGTYHMTNAGSASWHGFASAIIAQRGSSVRINAIGSDKYPTPARRPRFSVLDTMRTDALIGALPSWEAGLARYVKGLEKVS